MCHISQINWPCRQHRQPAIVNTVNTYRQHRQHISKVIVSTVNRSPHKRIVKVEDGSIGNLAVLPKV
jgi:hypothetical protein